MAALPVRPAEAAIKGASLFFYPPPWTLPDGTLIASPVTVAAEQATDEMPVIPEMDGVAVIVYWSALCPRGPACDFSLIDRILAYWSARGKSVVLGVATVGYPIRAVRPGPPAYDMATPPWVLAEVPTFHEPARTIGAPLARTEATFPVYGEPRFMARVADLVRGLGARYDGNPALSEVRIATGLLTEDNPSVDGLRSAMPGFSDLLWVGYCRSMVALYRANFRSTRLEFDIGRIPWMMALGPDASAAAARAFLESLVQAHVMIAFNGLASDDAGMLRRDDGNTGPGQALRFLAGARREGDRVGLESGPLSQMQDLLAIADAVRLVSPDRLIFFADVPAIIDENASIVRQLGPAQVPVLALKARVLLVLLDLLQIP